MNHGCAQCKTSVEQVASFKGTAFQRNLFRVDELLHRFECRHGCKWWGIPGLWRVRVDFEPAEIDYMKALRAAAVTDGTEAP